MLESRVKRAVVAVLVGILVLFLFISLPRPLGFSSYAMEEPQRIAHIWEMMTRGEWTLRCQTHYASGIGNCTVLSGVFDAAVVKTFASLIHEHPVTADPEFINPYLQYFLAFLRAVLASLFIALGFFCLTGVGVPLSWGLILCLCYASIMPIRLFAFDIGGDAEVGGAQFLIFCLFVKQALTQKAMTFVQGIGLAFLATLKLPVLLFALIALNSWKAALGFFPTLTLLLVGLLRSPHEAASYFFSLAAVGNVEFDQIASKNLWDVISINFPRLTAGYWYLFPLAGTGLILFFKRSSWISLGRLLAVFGLIFLALKSKNGQPRYFIGMTGACMVLCMLGSSVFKGREKVSVWGAALVIAFTLAWNVPGFVWFLDRSKALWSTGEILPSASERRILELLDHEPQLALDVRLRANLEGPPLQAFRSRIKLVDVVGSPESFSEGTLLVTLCYPTHDPHRFGLEDWGELQHSIEAQCGNSRLVEDQTIRSQNNRFIPIRFMHFQPQRGELLVEHRMSRKRPTPLHLRESVTVQSAFFHRAGPWSQEWGSSVASHENILSDQPFSLSKLMDLPKGVLKIEANMKSNFRNPGNVLLFSLNGERLNGEHLSDENPEVCDLSTQTQMSRGRENWVPFLREFYIFWKRQLFEIPCKVSLNVPKSGQYRLTIELKAKDPRGSVRFQEIHLKPEKS